MGTGLHLTGFASKTSQTIQALESSARCAAHQLVRMGITATPPSTSGVQSCRTMIRGTTMMVQCTTTTTAPARRNGRATSRRAAGTTRRTRPAGRMTTTSDTQKSKHQPHSHPNPNPKTQVVARACTSTCSLFLLLVDLTSSRATNNELNILEYIYIYTLPPTTWSFTYNKTKNSR